MLSDCARGHGKYSGVVCPQCEADRRHEEMLELKRRTAREARDREAAALRAREEERREAAHAREEERRWREEEAARDRALREREAERDRQAREELAEREREEREEADAREDERAEAHRAVVEQAASGKTAASQHLRDAIDFLGVHEVPRAVALVDRALDKWPTYPWAWLVRAIACGHRDDPDGRMNSLKKAVAFARENGVDELGPGKSVGTSRADFVARVRSLDPCAAADLVIAGSFPGPRRELAAEAWHSALAKEVARHDASYIDRLGPDLRRLASFASSHLVSDAVRGSSSISGLEQTARSSSDPVARGEAIVAMEQARQRLADLITSTRSRMAVLDTEIASTDGALEPVERAEAGARTGRLGALGHITLGTILGAILGALLGAILGTAGCAAGYMLGPFSDGVVRSDELGVVGVASRDAGGATGWSWGFWSGAVIGFVVALAPFVVRAVRRLRESSAALRAARAEAQKQQAKRLSAQAARRDVRQELQALLDVVGDEPFAPHLDIGALLEASVPSLLNDGASKSLRELMRAKQQ